MVGFKKGASPKKESKKNKLEKRKEEAFEEQEAPKKKPKEKKIKEKKPTKVKKSRFSRKKDKGEEIPVENINQEDLFDLGDKKEKVNEKCHSHLCGLDIDESAERAECVGDPTYIDWFMDCLKSDILPPINATCPEDRYTSELGKEIRIAIESISDDTPEDVIVEDPSVKIETEDSKNKRKELEVKIL